MDWKIQERGRGGVKGSEEGEKKEERGWTEVYTRAKRRGDAFA